MANSLTTRVANIVFNTKGVNAILNYQKQLVKDKKQQLDIQKQLVDSMNGTEKTYAAEVKTLNKLTAEWKKLEKEEQTFKSDLNAVTSTINNMGEASPRAINKLNSALARMSKNMGSMTAEAKEKFDALVGAIKPVTEALSQKFQKGFTDMMSFKPNTATWAELNNYVKEYNANGRILAEVSNNEAKAFADMGAKAAKCMIEMGKMDGTLTKLSADADPTRIREYIAAWQKIQNFQGSNATIKAGAQNAVALGQAQLANSNANMLMNGTGTQAEMQAATKELQTYMANTKLAKDEVIRFNEAIARGAQNMKASNMDYYTKQMQNVKTLSKDALADNKKYWQALVSGAAEGSHAQAQYNIQLQKAIAEEQRRADLAVTQAGNKALLMFNNGSIQKNTTSIKENIDALQKLRVIAEKKGDAKLVSDIDNACRQLNRDLVSCQENVKLAEKYMSVTSKGGAFKGTIADLEKVRSGLNDMRKKLKDAGDTAGVQKLDAALRQVDNDIRTAGIDAKEFEAALKTPASVSSLNTLKAAYAKLEAEIKRSGITQDEFNKKAAKMKEIRGRINELTKQFQFQNSALETNKSLMASLGTNLKNIVLHYIGLQMVMMRIINTFKSVFELSDQMTNVQKVTGMTATEVTRLVDQLQAIDSRTDTSKLMEYAEQAGKLGIYAKQGVEGMKQFAEMGERINRTLGEDAGGAQAIADLVKINDIMGTSQEVMKRTGNATTQLRDALDATGSAILNVGNNSSASYANVMNYVGRLGAIGSTCKMAVTDVIALGGALDALKMPAEAGSTAMSQFIAAIQRRTDQMAEAAKVSVVQLRELAQNDMMGAIQLLIGQVQKGAVSAQDLMDAMSGRSKINVNLRNSLNLLAGHMEMLNDQLRFAEQGFNSAFGRKTLGDITLIKSALDSMNLDSSFANFQILYDNYKSHGMEQVLSDFKKYSGDADMLRASLVNVFVEMENLDKQGQLNAETFQELFTSTSTMSIMEQEFARVNENAAGKVERLSNILKEKFVNSGTVEFFQNLTSGIMEFALWMQSGEPLARALGSAIMFLSTALLAAKTNLTSFIMVKVWGTITGWITLWGGLIKQVGLYQTALIACRGAWVKFTAMLKANWAGAVLAALAAIMYWMKSINDEATRFAKITQEATKALNDEVREASFLFNQAKKLNEANKDRATIIGQINSKYGTLLGYMIQEKATAQQLAAAYGMVITKLKEKNRLQIGQTLTEMAQKEGADEISRAGKDLQVKSDLLYKYTDANGNRRTDFEKSTKFQSRVTDIVTELVTNNANKTYNEIAELAKEKIKSEFNLTVKQINWLDEGGAVWRLAKGVQKQAKAQERTSALIAGMDIANNREASTNRAKDVKAAITEWQGYNKKYGKDISKWDEKAINYMLPRLKSIINDKDKYKQAVANDPKLIKTIDNFAKLIPAYEKEMTRRGAITPWGNPKATGPMETWDADVLKAYAAKLNAARMSTHDNADWSQIFPDIEGITPGMSKQEVNDLLDKEHEKVTEILKSQHLTTNGNFHHPSSSNRTTDTTQQEMEDARKHLEEYYKRREEMATNALNEGKTNEDAYNAYILANNQEMLKNQEILEQKFLDKNKKFTNDSVNEWMKSIEGVDGKKITINYSKIESYLAGKGKHLVGKVRDNAAKYAAELTASIRKNNKEIEKLLLDERPIAKVAQSFMEDLNKMNLMFTEVNNEELMTSNTAQQMAADRLTFLMEEAKKGYSLTAEQFIKDMRDYGGLSPWADALVLDQDKLNMLLIKTQGFMEQYEDAVRKMITKVGKRIEQEWAEVDPDTGKSLNQETEESKMKLENSMKQQSLADSWGFTGNNLAGIGDTDKLKMQQLHDAVELEKERFRIIKERYDYELAAIKEKMANETDPVVRAQLEAEAQATQTAALRATEEQLQKLTAARKAESDAQLELMSKTVDQIRPYYDNLNSFAQSFGENIFGSKEDRKKAAKELLISTIETTGKMLTQWLVYIATKKIYDKMEEYQNIKHQQTMLAQTLMVHSLLLQEQGKFELADAAMKESMGAVDAAAAAGKEAAKAGWIGMAIGAALSLAMTLAMSAATSKLKQTVSATTGASAGKLTTGMLTYAQGRYPAYADGTMQVQGNDGRSYNAVVKPNLTTGEYNRPHLGIVGEKGAELIVDSPTYRNIQKNAPWILRGIYDMKRFGTTTLNHAVANRAMRTLTAQQYPTHAAGNIDSKLGIRNEELGIDTGGASNEQLMATLTQLTAAITTLQSEGVKGHFPILGDGGLVDSYDKGKKFNTMVGK